MKSWHLTSAIVLFGIFLSINGFPATYDLTGQATVISSGHWNKCGVSNPTSEQSAVIFSQHGDSASIYEVNEGFVVEALLSGSQYTIVTDYCQDVGGVDFCAPSTCTFTATSDSYASGTCSWTRSDGNTCSGGYNISLTKEFQSSPTYNATGLWIFSEQPGGSNNCGVQTPALTLGTLTMTQTGNKATAIDSNGKQYDGFVSGSSYTLVTYYYENYRTVSLILTVTLGGGGMSGSGSCRWFWEADTLCGGEFALLVDRAWTITAGAGAGGTISPIGSVTVPYNGNQTFIIVPNQGYLVQDVLVDGVLVGATKTYTFSNVQASHTIEAVFRKNGGLPFLQLLFDD